MIARLLKFACVLLFLTYLSETNLLGFQESDSTKNDHQIHHISGALLSTGDKAPFWIRANNSQRISDAPNSVWQRVLFQKELKRSKRLDWGYGLDVIGRLGDDWSGDFTQAYLEGKNRYFNLFIGRKEEILGVVDSTLSIGPLVNGNNALPIPKVAIRTNGWLNVPFTKGLFKFNGYYAHGWFEEDRFVQNTLLHQKYLYLKIGKKKWPVNVYSGIIWNTQWGGRRSDNGEKEPSSFSDYLRIITGSQGGDNASQSDQANALGNHLGSWDSGFISELNNLQLHLYWQFLWEDGSGLTPFNWRDGIMGLSLKRKDKKGWFQGINLEIVRTNDQDAQKIGEDGIPFLEPDNFFNNSQYRSGWTYRNQVVGNPIFLLRDKNDLSLNRVSNLINATNLGVEGTLGKWNYTFNYIYFKNQGTHFQRFDESLKLHTIMIKGAYQMSSNNKLIIQLSLDSGNQINSSIGLGLEYQRTLF